MSVTMTPLIAANLMYAVRASAHFWFVSIALFAAVLMLVVVGWQLLDNWKKRTRGRKWPAVSAVVDIVSVDFCEDSTLPLKADSSSPYYLATLTYTYRNPEQQTGDYSRRFSDRDEAQDWADSYKGETVKVHVDPRDPARSVLREEDL